MIRPAAGTEAAEVQNVSAPKRIDQVHVRYHAGLSGRSTPIRVECRTTSKRPTKDGVHEQVRGSDGLTRFQGRGHCDTRNLREQRERAIQPALFNHLSALQ